jgi:hypothetical protein
MSSGTERNRVIPCLEPLEDRILCLIRQGGEAVQVGSSLVLELGSTPSPAKTLIATDGRGDVALEWDGGPIHYFFGVESILVSGQGSSNQVVFDSLRPLHEPAQLDLFFSGLNNILAEHVPGSTPLTVNATPPVPKVKF